MGAAIDHLCAFWDEVTQDFLEGQAQNIKPPLDRYYPKYRKQGELQPEGFCEPFLGDLSKTPKIVFLSLNPGDVKPQWQHRDHEGSPGIFVREIQELGSYTAWAASWSFAEDHWQKFIGPNNHHQLRFDFMRHWYEDDSLQPSDRVDFELYPWHSKTFQGSSLKLDLSRPDDLAILKELVWDPLMELQPPFIFAFGEWWRANIDKFPLRVTRRLGWLGDTPIDIGYRAGSNQGVVVAETEYGGLVVAEKHGGPSPRPPAKARVDRFRAAVMGRD
jgi:hypothetical protein